MQDQEHWQSLIRQKKYNLLFNEMVEHCSEPLYWHIRSIVLRHDWADDVLQESFVKAWKSLTKFRGDSQLYTWLYRIATREALALLKKEKRFQIGEEAFQFHLSSDPYFDGDEALNQLINALEKLPERQRTVFQLKYFQDLSFQEISLQLEVSVGALKASYHHAKEKIKNSLNLSDLKDSK